MKDVKIKCFDDAWCTERDINEFLEENNVEYVDMISTLNRIYLVYREKENMPKRKPYERYPENEKENEQNG